MRGLPVSEKYRGIKSDGIMYHGLVKYRVILCGGIDDQYTSYQARPAYFRVINRANHAYTRTHLATIHSLIKCI